MRLPHKSGINTTRQTTRRGVLGLLGAGSVASCSPVMQSLNSAADAVSRSTGGRFLHGVASGDPRADSVLLWTRVSADEADAPVDVSWELDTDPAFANPKRGTTQARPARDHCVKVVVDGLQPGTAYHYRFTTADAQSTVGRTKTLPADGVRSVRFAVVSCSNWEHGYFNVYDLVTRHAKERSYDAMIHLGDYYYEYGARVYNAPNTPDERVHEPANEIITLADYRARHAQYRSDPNLQSATAAMPLIALWDDHETANDSWRNGAQNHDASEGNWARRTEAALQAYWDWMPVRDIADRESFWREYRFGDLLSLVAVETRLTARAEPLVVEEFLDDIVADADGFKSDVLGDPAREMLGDTQRDYIVDTFARSKDDGVAWRMMANQVILGRIMTPDFGPYINQQAVEAIEKDWPGIHDFLTLSQYNMPMYPDSWDGYPAARERFYAALDAAGVNDLLVVTGDAHEFWANRLSTDAGTPMGAEFVTSSVSSKTLVSYLGDATADHNLLLTKENADVRYYNATPNGYVELEIGARRAEVTMWAVNSVRDRDYAAYRAAGFTVSKRRQDGKRTLRIGRPRGLNLTQRVLFAGLG